MYHAANVKSPYLRVITFRISMPKLRVVTTIFTTLIEGKLLSN